MTPVIHVSDPVPSPEKHGGGVSVQGYGPKFVTITSDDGDLSLICRLGPAGAEVTAGGGWQLIPRQGRRPLVHWAGSEAPTMTLDLMIDRVRTNKSVEDDVRVVEQMAGALVAGDTQPPPLIVSGAAVPHSLEKSSSARWVIAEPPDWGEKMNRYDGQRIRQQVTLTLYLLTEGDELEVVTEAADSPPAYRVVQSKADDTFATVAARDLKNKKLGTKLAQLNRDFHSAFKHATATTRTEGLTVRLPTSATKKLWEQAIKGK